MNNVVLVCIMAARSGEVDEWLKSLPAKEAYLLLVSRVRILSHRHLLNALIAQLDRALGYELRGREFESL